MDGLVGRQTQIERQIDRYRFSETDRKLDRQIKRDRLLDQNMYSQIDRQMDRYIHRWINIKIV